MANRKLNIFFYPAWYPHRGDAMFGLFVKRHAEAVNLYAHVGVVFAYGETYNGGSVYHTQVSHENDVKTVRVYFRKSTIPFIKAILNAMRYGVAVRRGYATLVKTMGKPDVNHVHILTRAGMFPFWKKITKGTPYIVTEHWSRYLPINAGAFTGGLRKWFTKKIVKHAYAVTPVSPRLAEAMQNKALQNDHYTIINNVVDTDNFQPAVGNNECLNWLHVSCFDEHPKNIRGLLNGFAEAYKNNNDLRLTLVGNGIDWEKSKAHAQQLNLPQEVIRFTGMLQGEALQKEFKRHDAFVMFSRFENQPVVIIEAFACGLPVVATAVGSIPEMLQDHRGIAVPSENEEALTQALLQMAGERFAFSRSEIREYAVTNFSMQAVGKRFYELYLSALENKRP